MRIDQIIWGTTGVIVTVAIATQTNILKNLINKVKNPPHSGFFFFDDDDSGGGDPTADWPDWMKNLPPGMTIYPGSPGLPGGGGGGGGAPWPGATGGGGGGSGPNSGQGGAGGDPGIPSRGSTRQNWGSGNFPQGFYFYLYDPLVNERYPSVINSLYLPNEPSEPNFTQPLVPPDINKEIESQEPTKKHKKKKKHHHYSHDNKSVHPTTADENLDYLHSQYNPYAPSYEQPGAHNDEQQQVYTQIECPDDPNSVPCGYNCYMNGQLMTVDCTTPYNYNPYRSGGPSPDYSQLIQGPAPPPSYSSSPSNTLPPDFTSTSQLPDQNDSIHPTMPEQNATDRNSQYDATKPSHLQPQLISPSGSGITPIQVTWNPYTKSGPCKPGNLHEHVQRETCRYQTNLEDLYGGDYMISASVGVGDFSQSAHGGSHCIPSGCNSKSGCGSCHPRVEITSGGPGSASNSQSCCGFTMSINNADGTMHMEQEGPGTQTPKGGVYCSDSLNESAPPCTGKGNSVTGGKTVYGKQLGIEWVKSGGRYGGAISGPTGRFPTQGYAPSPRTPKVGIITECPHGKCADSTRIRVDSADNVDFGGLPKVYRLTKPVQWASASGFYY